MNASKKTPSYYAVIFTSKRTNNNEGYETTDKQMFELAKKQPGFIAVESARSGIGISISYWKDLDSIRQWKSQAEHKIAQQKGKDFWYQWYKVRIAKIESEYEFRKEE